MLKHLVRAAPLFLIMTEILTDAHTHLLRMLLQPSSCRASFTRELRLLVMAGDSGGQSRNVDTPVQRRGGESGCMYSVWSSQVQSLFFSSETMGYRGMANSLPKAYDPFGYRPFELPSFRTN